MLHLWNLFDPEYTLAGTYLAEFEYPWQALPGLGNWILEIGKTLGDDYEEKFPGVWIHRNALAVPTAFLEGPCIFGPGTQLRHGSYIRGNVLAGKNCVIGNSTEVKNAILFDGVQIPHFNYAGDSILGHRVHLGAGAILSNVRSDKQAVRVRWEDRPIGTGLRKLGALIGDFGEIGCNAVLNPGTVIGRYSQVYPGSSVRGLIPENSIRKCNGLTVRKEAR